MFQSLLIPIDLTSASSRVVQRAARLPLAAGGKLTLLHVVPGDLPRSSRLRAEADARKALNEAARDLARPKRNRVAMAQVVKTGAAAVEIAEEAKRLGADLVVMGRGGGRAFRDVFLGSTAERVLRRARIPVLVARLPARGPYRRPLLALDTDPVAADVLRAALLLLAPPRPRLGLVHAYDIPYYGIIYPSLSKDRDQELHQDYRQRALREMAPFLSAGVGAKASIKEELRWKTHIRHGPPRRVIPEAVKRTRADLLALGTHGYSGIAHALLGTVAGDILRDVQCDVLVVPPGSAKHRRARPRTVLRSRLPRRRERAYLFSETP